MRLGDGVGMATHVALGLRRHPAITGRGSLFGSHAKRAIGRPSRYAAKAFTVMASVWSSLFFSAFPDTRCASMMRRRCQIGVPSAKSAPLTSLSPNASAASVSVDHRQRGSEEGRRDHPPRT